MKYLDSNLAITLEAAIDYHPLTVEPDMELLEAITLMSKIHSSCNLTSLDQSSSETVHPLQKSNATLHRSTMQGNIEKKSELPSSCAFVLEGNQLVGILTERDIVKYAATGLTLNGLKVSEVMSSELITLKKSELKDLLTIFQIFRQHHIRHLPILDNQNQIVGLITHNSIRKILQPADMLRWRRVKEVMNADIISVLPTASLQNAAQKMAQYQVSCVVVGQVEDSPANPNQEGHLTPLGIITERDIVQFQALALSFEYTPVAKVMSAPLYCLTPEDSLWEAHQQMERLHIRRLGISESSGALKGLITQSHILKTLDPTEMYRVVQMLQQEVQVLQSENLQLWQDRNLELEREVVKRTLDQGQLINSLKRQTAKLKLIYKQVNFLSAIALRIHQSLNLEEILKTIVVEVQQWLKTDRVLIYRVEQGQGSILVESVNHPQWSILGRAVEDHCFNTSRTVSNIRVTAIEDIQAADLTPCYLEFLQQFQVRANLVIPIVQEDQLWGLLICHHCSAPRSWQDSEIDFLKKLVIQLGIAVNQAELYQQSQTELQERQRTQEQLKELNEKLELRVAERTAQLRHFSSNLKTVHRLNTSKYQNCADLFTDYLQTGCELFGLETGIIGTIDKQWYKIRAVRSPMEELQPDLTFEIQDTYCAAVVREKKTITYQKVGDIPSLRQHPVYQNLKLEAYIGTPIFVRHEIYGTLNFSSIHSRIHLWETEEQEIIELMAQSLGNFIASHQLELERTQVEQALRKTNQHLLHKLEELEQNHREMALLGEMSDFLQACLSVEEAYKILGDLLQPLFPGCSGGVFIINETNKIVERVAEWGEAGSCSKALFSSQDCWALRRGRNHWVHETQQGLLCPHVQKTEPITSLCIPMMAQGESSGLLYLNSSDPHCLTDHQQELARTVSEHIALALANLKLRDTLQQQSTRDPLTGLFNRRYLEDFMEQAIARAKRQQKSLGLILLDIDYFKQFNDTFGHSAGDLVLQELSLLLLQNVRGSDLVCRYGGEELVLIFPDAAIEDTAGRGEQLRKVIKKLQVRYQDQPLGKITVSLGLACFPDHGDTGEELIQKADEALYQAKAAGRDRLIIASCSSLDQEAS